MYRYMYNVQVYVQCTDLCTGYIIFDIKIAGYFVQKNIFS